MINNNLYENGLPPRIEDVKIYFNQKGIPDQEAEAFFHFYERKLWKSKAGNYFKGWKAIAFRWIASILKTQPWLFTKNIS
jgi:hypothetical protein